MLEVFAVTRALRELPRNQSQPDEGVGREDVPFLV